MTNEKTILAATDLSASARHAVERASYLAACTGSELFLLHAIELDALDSLREMLGDDVSRFKTRLAADARMHLEQLTAEPGMQIGISARTRVTTGHPLSVIAADADALDAQLVVLGAHGESVLRRALLGSTAARLLRKAARWPVLVVKQAPHAPYRSVLVAVDFSPASLQAIRLARQWARDADLLLLHAFELPFEGKLNLAGVEERIIREHVDKEAALRLRRLHALAAEAGLANADYRARVIHGDPSQQIVAMEQQYDIDLIVIGKHGDHIAEELLLGSVTKHVLAESQCDVLVICDPRAAPEPDS